jgi:hypothetical protein
VDENAKLVTTVWFSDAHEVQEGAFPAGALDRAEEKAPVSQKKPASGKKPGKK